MYIVLKKKVSFFFLLLVALAVYNRSPSAYEALRDLKILQLPHSKTLKKVIKGGSEKSGIDEGYLQGQQQIYEEFQRRRETEGHPRPLGIGVMMWDEVKVIVICTLTLMLLLNGRNSFNKVLSLRK